MHRFTLLSFAAVSLLAACSGEGPTEAAFPDEPGISEPGVSEPGVDADRPSFDFTGFPNGARVTVTVTGTDAKLDWPTAADNSGGVVYEVELKGPGTSANPSTTQVNTATTHTFNGLAYGDYIVKVIANEVAPCKGPQQGKNGPRQCRQGQIAGTTFTVQAPAPSKQGQTISLGSAQDQHTAYGVAPFDVQAVATSKKAVALAASGAKCALGQVSHDAASGVSKATLTVTGAGSCKVTANQGGDSQFEPAPEAELVFTVDKATPTLDLTVPGPLTYDGQQHAASVKVTGVGGAQLSGASLSYTDKSSNAALSGGAPKDAGDYSADADFQGDEDHHGAWDSKTITINKKDLTVTADDKNMFYGDAAPPAFSAKYNGFVAGESEADLGGALAFGGSGGSANGTTPVGSYDIVPSGHSARNYQIGYAKGTLKIVYWAPAGGYKFGTPINASGTRSSFKQGSTVPLKFQVLTAAGASVGGVVNALLVTPRLLSTSTSTAINEATVSTTGSTGNTFRYDATADQYIYNLATKDLQAGVYELKADLGDGVTRVIATVELRSK